MRQHRLTTLLLMPSLSSGTAVLCIALIVLGYSGWLFISENRLFYDYLFGPYGLHTFVWEAQVGGSIVNQRLLSSPLAYYALVGSAAIAAGLVVYTILQGVGMLFQRTKEVMEESLAHPTSRRTLFTEQLGRLGLRIISLAGWGVYGAFFVSTLIPFTIVLTQFGIGNIQKSNVIGWVQCAAALALFAIGLHLQVVFLRLSMLRPRIFGGDTAIEEAEAQ